MSSSSLAPRLLRASLYSVVAAGLLAGLPAYADQRSSALSQTVDAAVGAGSSTWTGAVSWNPSYGLGHSRRFRIGLGVRLASFFGGDDLSYTTADATLIKQDRVNMLAISGARTNSLNLELQLKYRFLERVEAGFDIDLLGAGFGKATTGSYRSTDPAFSGAQRADVSSFNLLKGGSPDRGELDSEFFFAYWWSDRQAVRAGFSHFLSEYTTVNRLDFGNDRYRHSANLGFVGLTFKP